MLAALVVPVITLVILLSSSQLDRATRRLRELPILALLSVLTAVAVVALLVVLVGYQRAIGKVGTIEETRRQGGPARSPATWPPPPRPSPAFQSELDALLRS